MKSLLSILLLFLVIASSAQPLRDINYEYLYDPDATVRLELRPVKGSEDYTILYNLQVSDTAGMLNQYSLEWEARNLLGDKEGRPVVLNDLVVSRHASGFQGRGTLPVSESPRYLMAKVTNNKTRRAWLFYTALQPNYPVDNYLLRNGFPVDNGFVRPADQLKAGLEAPLIISYYNDDFPAAAPVFSEAQARVSAVMAVDSVFTISSGEEFSLGMRGLYLIQRDTNAVVGVTVRSEDDYPQYTQISKLAGPLIYITTRQEYDRLEAARGNKKVFDRVILGIVADTDRARTLMRNYFRRVELANRFFTSYKEGWKTDRGMVYIIFGRPQEVYRFDNREVWSYNTNQFDISFTFSKASTLFDPDNFVLIREKKYESTWYEVIDLWRNARF